MSETKTTSLTFPRADWFGVSLACDGSGGSPAYAAQVRVLRAPDSKEGLLATDGKRLHATRPALNLGAVEAHRVPLRALEALSLLLGDKCEHTPWRSDPGELHVAEDRASYGVRFEPFDPDHPEGPDLGKVLSEVASFRSGDGRSAVGEKDPTVKKWKAFALSKHADEAILLLSGASGFPLVLTPWQSVGDEEGDALKALKEKQWETMASLGVSRIAPVKASYLRDAARWVGDGCNVFLPANGTRSGHADVPIVLESGDGERTALVMPVNLGRIK